MSLLLDALKKAALEKQRREQSNTQPNSSPSTEPTSTSPEKIAPSEIKTPTEQVTREEIPAQNISPVESTIAATINDLDQLNSELEAVAAKQIDETHAKTETTSLHQGADLIFDINEIDPSYLEPETQEKNSTDALPGTGIVEEFVRRANVRDDAVSNITLATDEPVFKAVDELPIPTSTASVDIKPLQVKSEEIKQPQVGSDKSVPHDPVAASTEPNAPQIAAAVTEQTDKNYTQNIKALFDDKAKPVEAFSALSGKAALVQLLERSKKAANAARKRMMLMYGFLSITAILIVVFYYYLLHSEALSVIALAPQNHAPVNAEAVSTEPVSEAAAGVEQEGSPEPTIAQTSALPSNESDTSSGSLTANATAPAKQKTLTDPAKSQQVQSQTTARRLPKSTRDSSTLDSSTHEVLPAVSVPKQAMIVERNADVSAVSEAIDRGYKAYQRGDISAASEAYQEALRQDPHQRDAMLGAAAVAVRQGRQQDALKIYQQRLARDPKDQYAQSGILALSENAEQNPELDSELSRLLLEYPDAAHLHFLKGSLYAARQQWAAAQVSFFEAWQRDNKNPDLAFNLAVALDHLAQPKEAARFYHQALTLGDSRPASFSVNAIQRRLQDLEGASYEGTNHEGMSP